MLLGLGECTTVAGGRCSQRIIQRLRTIPATQTPTLWESIRRVLRSWGSSLTQGMTVALRTPASPPVAGARLFIAHHEFTYTAEQLRGLNIVTLPTKLLPSKETIR